MARRFSQRSLNSLRGVHPDLVKVIERALQSSPVDFIVIEGLRTVDRQKELVATGASRTMNSRHLTGHAVDLLPIGSNGKAEFAWPLYEQLAPAVKQAADDLGVKIVWGGDWRNFRDGPHFELDRLTYPAEAYEPTAQPPVERTSVAQSTTVQASAIQVASGAGAGLAAVGSLDGTAQIVALVGCIIIVGMAMFIMRERLRAWSSGWR